MAIIQQARGLQNFPSYPQPSPDHDWPLCTHLRENIKSGWEWDRIKLVRKVDEEKQDGQKQEW